ncbi:hypothetical protein [Chitinophaga solisilvae]|uniref:hypothetical protein n=1 Tax=Chitinophaga solisilvae TaxID=1233460 RepID=UPI001371F0E7|nr:hypothetical protein [Chitinophaga solisilvae]
MPDNHSFGTFLLNRSNRIYLLLSAAAAILQLTVFKLLYPYADYFSDSYSYIFAAMKHLGASIWPIGYSRFIGLFHLVSTSDTALVSFQYITLCLAELYFFFTICYLYNPGKIIRHIIFIFLIFNPASLYLSNYISSDALFLAMSLCWITQLLWMMHQPERSQIIVITLLVAVAFTFRYNAMFYPVLTAVIYLMSGHKPLLKITGILAPVILIGLFVSYTRTQTRQLTGTAQFSVFSGWQLANNALYMYPYITVDKAPPPSCLKLHQAVNQYFDTIHPALKLMTPMDGAFYLKYSAGPLKTYLAAHTNDKKDTTGGIRSWGTVSPVFADYGKFLILHHPLPYIEFFLLPNFYNYCIPPVEKLEVYNLGAPQVGSIARKWFHYPSSQVTAFSFTAQGIIFQYYPYLFLLINLCYFSITLFWWTLKTNAGSFGRAVVVIFLFFLLNAAFGILASPIVLRYQILPMVILFSFALTTLHQLRLNK